MFWPKGLKGASGQKGVAGIDGEEVDSILSWFLKDHVTLKTGVMMLKNPLWHHRNRYS